MKFLPKFVDIETHQFKPNKLKMSKRTILPTKKKTAKETAENTIPWNRNVPKTVNKAAQVSVPVQKQNPKNLKTERAVDKCNRKVGIKNKNTIKKYPDNQNDTWQQILECQLLAAKSESTTSGESYTSDRSYVSESSTDSSYPSSQSEFILSTSSVCCSLCSELSQKTKRKEKHSSMGSSYVAKIERLKTAKTLHKIRSKLNIKKKILKISSIQKVSSFQSKKVKIPPQLRHIAAGVRKARERELKRIEESKILDVNLKNPKSLLVPSLFPNVPPYLAFSCYDRTGPEVPELLRQILVWKNTRIMPKIMRQTLENTGIRILRNPSTWMGVWGKHLRAPLFRKVRCFQKVNHIPGSFQIGRKDSCWRCLNKQIGIHGNIEYEVMPKTYVMPEDRLKLRHTFEKNKSRNLIWIVKPASGARGNGISMVTRLSEIPRSQMLIVQKYIEHPFLIDGNKFDMRLYVLVTSMNPLRVYIYRNGLARFASVKYSDSTETLNKRCMHLTNYSVNKFSKSYAPNEDVDACDGHKWSLKSLFGHFEELGIRIDFLWDAICSLIIRTLIAGENSIINRVKQNLISNYNCFELFGFDILLDENLRPWLLEVNISPSLHSDMPLDAYVKAPLVQAILNTAMYHVPPRLTPEGEEYLIQIMGLPVQSICFDHRMYIKDLSLEEKIKHNEFECKAMEKRQDYINHILNKLTPDDVRCLVTAEDELARSEPLQRIFPTAKTHQYLKYASQHRYYNRLLDAWEHRYSEDREAGIDLLRSLCDQKVHLEVPPTKP